MSKVKVVMRATGVTPEEHAADVAWRQANAAAKDQATVRSACPSHTPEQQAERDSNAAAITRVWGEKVAGLMDLRNAKCSDLRRWGDAARAEEAKVAALRAAVAAPAKLRAAGPEVEAAELRALAIELYGRADIDVYTDQNGTPDPYRSESNKRSAIEAARIVRDQRQRFEARTAPLRAHQAEHRALASELGLFGSIKAQLARAVIRDAAARPGTKPLPERDGVPDPYARAIEAKRSARAAEQEKRDRKWGR